MVWLLNVKLGAVQSTYMAKLEIGLQLMVRIAAAYRAHFPAYRAQLCRYPARVGPHHTVRIPQHIVRIAQLIVRISRSISCATP